METIEASGIIGMVGLAALALNFIIGLCIRWGVRYTIPYKLTFLQLHKFSGYTAAGAIVVHVVLIPLDPKSGFTWGDLLLPAWTQHQPLANTFGSIAFYLLSIVVISSYVKDKLRYDLWRRLHYVTYFALVPLVLHSVITDPKLQDRPIDWFDAEKLFVIFCCLVMLGLSVYRFVIDTKMRTSKK